MGLIRYKGQRYKYDRKGFLSSLAAPFKKKGVVRRVVKVKRVVVKDSTNWGRRAKRSFFHNSRINRLDKYEDLLETSPQTRRVSKNNYLWWRKDIKRRDLRGIDTANEGLASTLLPSRRGMMDELAYAYKRGFGDVSAFKSKDKGYIESVKDEIESEWRF